MAANFWDTLLNVLGFLGKTAQKMNNDAEKKMDELQKNYDRQVNNYERRYSNCGDQQLRDRFNNSSSHAEKAACKKILDERQSNRDN